jgi:hypothetical protein
MQPQDCEVAEKAIMVNKIALIVVKERQCVALELGDAETAIRVVVCVQVHEFRVHS